MLHNEEIGCQINEKEKKKKTRRRKTGKEKNIRKEPKTCYVHMWLKFSAMPTQFDTHSPKRKLYKWATVYNKAYISFCLYTDVQQLSSSSFSFFFSFGDTHKCNGRENTKI